MHHKKKDCKSELLRLLREHGIGLDERYMFDSFKGPSPLRGEIHNEQPLPRVPLRSTRGYKPAPLWGDSINSS